MLPQRDCVDDIIEVILPRRCVVHGDPARQGEEDGDQLDVDLGGLRALARHIAAPMGSPKDHLTHLPVVGWRRVVHQEQKPVLRTRHAL